MEILEEEYAIGLDLGTTFSCIGAYRKGTVEIIPNKNGEKITPSVVIFNNDSSILVGEETREFLVKNYDSCIYEIKRLIGRKFTDEEVQLELKKLPFKIIKANSCDSPEVEIKVNGETKTYNPIEISSFIIKKMVKHAENYLNKSINKLVITVPAYFNDSQRKLTRQAAEMAGLKVLRIINEPTAAALSYGFDKTNDINEKILVFDLGGGTFDVSILSLKKEEKDENYLSFTVLGTSGDTQLGGEDFDNVLVNYFLEKRKDIEEKIRDDKKALKRLKVSCENIKKILSTSEATILRISDFFNNQDLQEPITRIEFETRCNHLFKKIENSLDEALRVTKLSKKDIKEIIMVGGSTRIPKVKELVKNYFPRCKINDSINPDEAVAYGATLEAEKILHNKDLSITNFHLFDITPLSLGTDVKNSSDDPEIQKEGDEMSIIIKRGTPIPTFNEQTYFTSYDNQTAMKMNIFEGEKKYTKYNHLLKRSEITGLAKRDKGKTKVKVTFDIDINGILNVIAKELTDDDKGQTLNLTIKNDEISLTPEQMEEFKKKNIEIFNKIKLDSKYDYTSLKGTLKKYKDSFEKSDDDDDKIIYLSNYNQTLEDFISLLDKNFDNETVLEKYYLYIKELFLSYVEILKLGVDRGEQKTIAENIQKYVKIFIDKSTGYLNDLIEILNKLTQKKKYKVFFYNIIISILEELNNCGKESIKDNKPFCKYHSLIYFEQAKSYYEKYLSNIDESLLKEKEMNSLKKQKTIFIDYIKYINTGAIVLLDECFRGGYLVSDQLMSSGRGITNDLKFFNIGNIENNIERCKIVLTNYERVLSTIQTENQANEREAICIANIIKLNQILGYLKSKSKNLLMLAKRCNFIIEKDHLDKEKEWCKEFYKFYVILNDMEKANPDEEFQEIFNRIRKSHGDIFDEINDIFNTKSTEEFIKYILEKHPFKNIKTEISKGRNLKVYNTELVRYLFEQYQPDNYTHSPEDEKSELNYCIAHEISKKLSNALTKY